MFAYIKGSLEYNGGDHIIVENNEIGYKVFTTSFSIGEFLKREGNICVYTKVVNRDDEMNIYGFSSNEEMDMFNKLVSVSGVGSKMALGILSSISLGQLVGAIVANDTKELTKAQGVGKKTAQRIVLELKDKVDKNLALIQPSFHDFITPSENHVDEATQALMSLGYKKSEVENAIGKIKVDNLRVEDIIKEVLKILSL
ncbi:MAG: Holliday junction branch migration protein RuvA [Anaeromicrobium sp.]|jgi:Holliday junction DNA helicase RuvA|uniref:Holliday junction branch migration protein RuvA n=1 Tax=Anaeromicrobium sp. TaxID=1929132 RepID=UPI0025F22D06|nr:Holliday junction branch migration protein RuvA [Anaeromicrobium sp.]MCT4594845.1 Holliday junction branch migration protein RuvA [Anaeromicrobium sp.]